MSTDLHHWHADSDDPSIFQPPPACCRSTFDKIATAARSEATHKRSDAVHAERVRIVTETLTAVELYAEQAGSLLTNEQSKDMLGLIAARIADVVRKIGCICPQIEVTSFGGPPSFLAGRHAKCGMHDDARGQR